MSVTTIDPPVQTETPPPARSWHFARWIAAGLVLIVVSAGIAAGSYAANYQPVVVSGSLLYTTNAPDGTSPSTDRPYTVNYVEGATELWGLYIRNAGRYPIAVTGAEWHGPTGSFGQVTLLLPTPAVEQGVAAIGLDRGLEPIHPFTLAPGQEKMILIRITMSGCIVPESGASQGGQVFSPNSLFVGFRAFGVSHLTAISAPPDSQLRIDVPWNAVCA